MMEKKESIEFFSESLKKAASRAREIGVITKNPSWASIAMSFDNLRARGETIYKNVAPNRQDILKMTDTILGHTASDQESKSIH